MKQVKIFGERNSSTNALKALIEVNSGSYVVPSAEEFLRNRAFQSVARRIGVSDAFRLKRTDNIFKYARDLYSWKHCCTNFETAHDFKNTLVLFCVRHPLSWLWALYRRPNEPLRARASFRQFLNVPWQTTGRDRLGGRLIMPAELYNTKMKAYLDFQKKLDEAEIENLTVKFEGFAFDQHNIFAELFPYLKDAAQTLSLLNESTKEPHKTRAFYRDYYGRLLWLSEMSEDDKDAGNSLIDWDIAERFGYSRNPSPRIAHE